MTNKLGRYIDKNSVIFVFYPITIMSWNRGSCSRLDFYRCLIKRTKILIFPTLPIVVVELELMGYGIMAELWLNYNENQFFRSNGVVTLNAHINICRPLLLSAIIFNFYNVTWISVWMFNKFSFLIKQDFIFSYDQESILPNFFSSETKNFSVFCY